MARLELAGGRRSPASRRRRWAVTLAATAARPTRSTPSPPRPGCCWSPPALLAGLDHRLLLAFLAASYVVWGAGLRVNLRANWALLERTGHEHQRAVEGCATTCRRRTRARRRAAAARGRLRRHRARQGGAVLRRRVRRRRAQRLGLVRATRSSSWPARTSAPPPTSTGSAGLTRALLGGARRPVRLVRHRLGAAGVPAPTTTRGVEPDELATIAFFVDACGAPSPASRCCSSASARRCTTCSSPPAIASEIHLADYLPANLAEIERWIDRDPDAHDWRPFVRYTLECEGVRRADRGGGHRPRGADAREDHPAAPRSTPGAPDPLAADRYATVISAYCADSATVGPRDLGAVHAQHRRPGARPAGCSSPRRCAARAATSSAASVPERVRRRGRPPRGPGAGVRRAAARSRSARWASTRRSATRASCSGARRRGLTGCRGGGLGRLVGGAELRLARVRGLLDGGLGRRAVLAGDQEPAGQRADGGEDAADQQRVVHAVDVPPRRRRRTRARRGSARRGRRRRPRCRPGGPCR